MSFPSQRDVDALTSFEDDEFDALLSGANSKLTPGKSPAISSAQSGSHSSSSARVRSSTVAVSTPSAPPPPKLQSPSKAAASPGNCAAATAAPLTFGSTAFLSELQNRRKHVLHDNSLKAGASDDDADPPQSASHKQALAASESAPKSAGSQRAAAADRVPGPAVAVQAAAAAQPAAAAADAQADKAAPDASACLRRLDRLPATVEKCLKECVCQFTLRQRAGR
jgi:hypothetical protein